MHVRTESLILHVAICRSCRIDECWIIKVADFGLTKSVYEKHYFREDKDESVKLPIKWMAIESIDDGIFTEKTDVVSLKINSLLLLLSYLYIVNHQYFV